VDSHDIATKARPAFRRLGAMSVGGTGAAASSFAAVTGTLVSLDPERGPLVDLPGEAPIEPLTARSCVALGKADIGKEAVILFEDGDRSRPLIVGILRDAKQPLPTALGEAVDAQIDGKHIILTGKESLTLHCGAASITLRADGKITIRAGEIESRAAGLNRIQGGSVRIN
jgi:hypothetical protein